MLSDVPQTVYLKDYRPPQFLVEQVDLDFDLGEEQTRVVARLLVQRGVVFVSACYVLFNIAVDVAQSLLDPRIKT